MMDILLPFTVRLPSSTAGALCVNATKTPTKTTAINIGREYNNVLIHFNPPHYNTITTFVNNNSLQKQVVRA
jgi:hypothetical protein